MPDIPDVRILHCGEQAHHKMGIKVLLSPEMNCPVPSPPFLQLQTFNNIEGGAVGKILSYYDLTDVPEQKETAGSETEDCLTAEEKAKEKDKELAKAEVERRQVHMEEMERVQAEQKREDQEKFAKLEKAKARAKEAERLAMRSAGEAGTVPLEDIFKLVNDGRSKSGSAKSEISK